MLENGESYDAALRAAQEKGYAEADPTADVEGIDAARKTCILAGLAFGKNVDPADIHVEGITKVTAADAAFAAAGGMKIKLLGRAMRQDEKLYCFVSPHFVPAGKILAAAGGVGNAVAVVGDMVGEVTFCGPGAGRYPTASAVVADIVDIARHPGREQPAGWATTGREAGLLSRLLRALVRADEGSKGGRGGEARCGRVAPGAGRLATAA